MKNNKPKIWRHGDVIIIKVENIPILAKKINTNILVRGENTRHSHKFQDPSSVQLYNYQGVIFFEVLNDNVDLIHEEHNPITFNKGYYSVRIQREYSPKAITRIRD